MTLAGVLSQRFWKFGPTKEFSISHRILDLL
jgi:hypothetical protein